MKDIELITFKWLKDNGFTDEEIVNIKNIYDKEGILFTVKSFRIEELDDIRQVLIELKKNDDKNIYKELFESVEGVDVELALNLLHN